MKNYIISKNKKLEIKNCTKITTDIHLYNHLKFKNKKIEFLQKKPNSKKKYISDYKIVKEKSLKYSKELRIFLNNYHKKKFSNKFWDKVLNEQLYRTTLLIYDFYHEFKYTLNKNYYSNISKENFHPPQFFHEIFTNFEFNNSYRDQIFKIFLTNFNQKKIHKVVNNVNSKFSKEKKNENYFNKNYISKFIGNFNLIFLFLENKCKKFFLGTNNIRIGIIKSYFHTKFRLTLENKSNLKLSTLNFPSYLTQNVVNYEVRNNLSNCLSVNDKFDFFLQKLLIVFFPKYY